MIQDGTSREAHADHADTGAAGRVWAAIAAVGQVLSALDDRNLPAALRVLEPARADDEAGRCTRCVTHGE
jgi:hypothetical protein